MLHSLIIETIVALVRAASELKIKIQFLSLRSVNGDVSITLVTDRKQYKVMPRLIVSGSDLIPAFEINDGNETTYSSGYEELTKVVKSMIERDGSDFERPEVSPDPEILRHEIVPAMNAAISLVDSAITAVRKCGGEKKSFGWLARFMFPYEDALEEQWWEFELVATVISEFGAGHASVELFTRSWNVNYVDDLVADISGADGKYDRIFQGLRLEMLIPTQDEKKDIKQKLMDGICRFVADGSNLSPDPMGFPERFATDDPDDVF